MREWGGVRARVIGCEQGKRVGWGEGARERRARSVPPLSAPDAGERRARAPHTASLPQALGRGVNVRTNLVDRDQVIRKDPASRGTDTYQSYPTVYRASVLIAARCRYISATSHRCTVPSWTKQRQAAEWPAAMRTAVKTSVVSTMRRHLVRVRLRVGVGVGVRVRVVPSPCRVCPPWRSSWPASPA